jgi:hypothetical protein
MFALGRGKKIFLAANNSAATATRPAEKNRAH